MKFLHSLLLLILLAATSCHEDIDLNSEPLPVPPPQPENNPTKISVDEAVALAENFPDFGVESRSCNRTANISNIVVIGNNNSRSGAKDTSIYIINYNDNKGFAAISAKRIDSPVLAVIDNGNYQETIQADNPGFNSFMEMALQYVDYESEQYAALSDSVPKFLGGDGDVTPVIKFKHETDTIANETVSPKLGNLTWGQQGTEGSLCPNLICGCGPLAIAMAMCYYQTPSINYTFSGRDVDIDIFNWPQLRSHSPRGDECYSCTAETHNVLGRLLREIGYRAETEYKSESSSTKDSKIRSTLKNLLPNRSISDYKNFEHKSVRNAISNGLVLMIGKKGSYSLSGKFTASDKGHAWIADGFFYQYLIVRKYQKTINEVNWKYIESEIKIKDYIHFNWGWRGIGNGYYSGYVFTVNYERWVDGGFKRETDYYSEAKYMTIR